MNQTDPNVSAVLSQLRALLLVIAGVLATEGYGNSSAYKWIMIGAGACVAIGTALWGLYNALVTLRKARAVGVQAGINLATSGNAVDQHGNPISKFDPNATPSKPVTVQSSDKIIKDYPPVAPIAKA